MIEILLYGFIHGSTVFKEIVYFLDLWYLDLFFFPIMFLICLGIIVLVILIIVFLLREFTKESTKRCPHCGNRIPTDAAWCKFCKRDLTKKSGSVDMKVGKPCPKCDKDMHYIEEYDRWYCSNCDKYK